MKPKARTRPEFSAAAKKVVIPVLDTVQFAEFSGPWKQGLLARVFGAHVSMTFFSQLDPAWKGDSLGTEGGTIGSLGCMVTSVAMAFASVGIDTDPGRLNKYLNENKGYQGSLLVWNVAMQVTAGKIKYCHAGTLESPEAILAGLQQAKLVIPRSNRYDWHWVYILQNTGGGSWKDFKYFDPADTIEDLHEVNDGLVQPGNATRVLKVLGTPAGDQC